MVTLCPFRFFFPRDIQSSRWKGSQPYICILCYIPRTTRYEHTLRELSSVSFICTTLLAGLSFACLCCSLLCFSDATEKKPHALRTIDFTYLKSELLCFIQLYCIMFTSILVHIVHLVRDVAIKYSYPQALHLKSDIQYSNKRDIIVRKKYLKLIIPVARQRNRESLF